MDRILLLVEHKENRRLLSEWLAKDYEVVMADTPQAFVRLDGFQVVIFPVIGVGREFLRDKVFRVGMQDVQAEGERVVVTFGGMVKSGQGHLGGEVGWKEADTGGQDLLGFIRLVLQLKFLGQLNIDTGLRVFLQRGSEFLDFLVHIPIISEKTARQNLAGGLKTLFALIYLEDLLT